MSEMPPSYAAPPPAAPAKRKIPTWAIIVGVLVLLCACGACALFALPGLSGGFSGGLAGAQLPSKCEANTDLSAEDCAAWTQGVVSDPAFTSCVQDLTAQGSLNADTLYSCLVDNGAGPE
jgi:hypothetical protein